MTSALKCVKLFFTYTHKYEELNSKMRGVDIIRSDDLRSENRHRLLSTLRRQGPSTPAQINQLTGLSAASISSLTSQMAEQNIVLSQRLNPDEPGTRGRPQSQVMLNANAGNIITLSLTIDLINAQRIDYSGTVCDSRDYIVDTRALNQTALLSALTEAVRRILPADGPASVQLIGVCFQGIIDHNNGTLSWSPIIQEKDVPLGKLLEDTFNIPVTVSNDCSLVADALSDTLCSDKRDSFATIVFSHGVGLGLYLEGKSFSGIHSSGLELGHLRFERNGALCRCGKLGCIEAYAANYGIARLATGQSILDTPVGRMEPDDYENLVLAAESGDQAAIQAFAIAGAAIGEGLASLFILLDPMPVALVGRNQRSFALMQKALVGVLRKELRYKHDYTSLFHCYDDCDSLLERGLTKNALETVDAAFARVAHAQTKVVTR